jgi:N-acetylmuramoyl-L-alanine amidase
MQIITRDQWGARPPKWREAISISKGVFIHYNGGSNLPANVVAGDFNAVCAHLRGVQSYHMNTQGWPDIAYSFCVDSVGRIYELRGWGVAGAHTLGWNWDSHAIYLPLGGDQAPTDTQIAAANQVIAEHDRRFGAGFVKGHQQAPNSTSCPGGPTMARILAGDFHATDPMPPPPPPDPDEDDVKPVIVVDPRPGKSAWHVFGNTRYRLASQAEIDVLTYMGVQVVTGDAANPDPIVNWLRSCKDLGRPVEK